MLRKMNFLSCWKLDIKVAQSFNVFHFKICVIDLPTIFFRYDPSAILDLIQATNSNPKLFQGVDKYG